MCGPTNHPNCRIPFRVIRWPLSNMWHYISGDTSTGPRDEIQVELLIREGTITRETLVWKEGTTDWCKAKDTTLAPLFSFASIPPPIPSSPVGPPSLPRTMSPTSSGFQNLSSLATWVTVLLAVGLTMTCVAVWSSFLQLDLLDRAANGVTVPLEEADANDARESLVGFVQLGIYIVTAIFFGRWIYVAATNIRSLGATRLVFTPGWAVGYYFIPIVNLWKPYQAMREIWNASHTPTARSYERGNALLGFWWTFWVLSNVAGQVAFRITMAGKTASEYITSTNVAIFAECVDMPLCILAILLIRKLSTAQARTAAARGVHAAVL